MPKSQAYCAEEVLTNKAQPPTRKEVRSVLKFMSFKAFLMPKGKLRKDPARSVVGSTRISTIRTDRPSVVVDGTVSGTFATDRENG
jgi:hypothetical protein